MSEVRPLCGIRYNGDKVPDLAAVICPPYDVISPAGQRALYERSPYNFVRIEYGEEFSCDTEADNKYVRAATHFGEWLTNGVLTEDATPAFYVHDHYFAYHGREYRRRGLVCRVRLEEWERMIVRPHENTTVAPKGDRMRLLGALGANTSPVMAMYRDGSGEIARRLIAVAAGEPVASSSLADGERHELFAISHPGEITCLEKAFAALPLYIADGHHRYESALANRLANRAHNPSAPTDSSFNFVLMTLVDMDDPELLILPPHRLLRGLAPAKLAELEARLGDFFDIDEMTLSAHGVWQAVDVLHERSDGLRLVLVGPNDRLRILTLRDFDVASRLIPGHHTDIYKKMDVSLVDHIILEEMMGVEVDDAEAVVFNYDREDTIQKVISSDCQLAFIVKPVSPDVIKDISDAQDRMPRKSTYFYPKLPSGLIVHRVA